MKTNLSWLEFSTQLLPSMSVTGRAPVPLAETFCSLDTQTSSPKHAQGMTFDEKEHIHQPSRCCRARGVMGSGGQNPVLVDVEPLTSLRPRMHAVKRPLPTCLTRRTFPLVEGVMTTGQQARVSTCSVIPKSLPAFPDTLSQSRFSRGARNPARFRTTSAVCGTPVCQSGALHRSEAPTRAGLLGTVGLAN